MTDPVFSWPRVVVHISPGCVLYCLHCHTCDIKISAVAAPFEDVVCPVCGCAQHAPGPMEPGGMVARGSDGIWIDPGPGNGWLYLN